MKRRVIPWNQGGKNKKRGKAPRKITKLMRPIKQNGLYNMLKYHAC